MTTNEQGKGTAESIWIKSFVRALESGMSCSGGRSKSGNDDANGSDGECADGDCHGSGVDDNKH